MVEGRKKGNLPSECVMTFQALGTASLSSLCFWSISEKEDIRLIGLRTSEGVRILRALDGCQTSSSLHFPHLGTLDNC